MHCVKMSLVTDKELNSPKLGRKSLGGTSRQKEDQGGESGTSRNTSETRRKSDMGYGGGEEPRSRM